MLFVPLKLSIAYAILLPSVLIWLISLLSLEARDGKLSNLNSSLSSRRALFPMLPLALFYGYAFFCSFFGANIPHSVGRSLRAMALLGFIPYFYSLMRNRTITHNNEEARGGITAPLIALICGQTLAAFHTTLNGILSFSSDDFLIGAVSESGQLGLMIPFAVALFFCRFNTCSRTQSKYLSVFLASALVLLVLALLINLKRGPWLGTVTGLGLLCLFYRPKLIIPLLLGVALLAVGIPAIHERLAVSLNHFFIGGGRSNIWNVGVQLVIQNPLGVGYDNSRIMQAYDPLIPPNLKHMHNNLLNLLVETGWIGATLFAYWIVHLLRYLLTVSAPREAKLLARGLVCSLVSWQIAGLVEYNIGDTEVLLIVLFLCTFSLYSITPSEKFGSAQPSAAVAN
jgi:O-antigen ligase